MANQARFNKLHRFSIFLSFTFTLIIILLFLSFYLAIVYFPEVLALIVLSSSINLGIIFALTLVLGAVSITGVYICLLEHTEEKFRSEDPGCHDK